ncbi:MAG: ferritin-like domain-containing protein [Actinobacteria bacterium]|nr:ferritin-like domain-containing protein [Actinomycetota bacterium]
MAAWLAACGGGGRGSTAAPNPAQVEADAAALGSLLDAERTAIAAYRLGSERLRGSGRGLMHRFLAQEQAHERALEGGIRSLGHSPSRPRPDAFYATGFPRLSGTDAVLRFALDVENTQIAAYQDALTTVTTPAVRATLGSILAVEAQHQSVVLGKLHEPQAPFALVKGSRPT